MQSGVRAAILSFNSHQTKDVTGSSVAVECDESTSALLWDYCECHGGDLYVFQSIITLHNLREASSSEYEQLILRMKKTMERNKIAR